METTFVGQNDNSLGGNNGVLIQKQLFLGTRGWNKSGGAPLLVARLSYLNMFCNGPITRSFKFD